MFCSKSSPLLAPEIFSTHSGTPCIILYIEIFVQCSVKLFITLYFSKWLKWALRIRVKLFAWYVKWYFNMQSNNLCRCIISLSYTIASKLPPFRNIFIHSIHFALYVKGYFDFDIVHVSITSHIRVLPINVFTYAWHTKLSNFELWHVCVVAGSVYENWYSIWETHCLPMTQAFTAPNTLGA